MKIVVDTNVLVSGIFFGGYPGQVLKYISKGAFSACVTKEIIEEYQEVVQRLLSNKKPFNQDLLNSFLEDAVFVETISQLQLCRDKDDDKFINCAIDSGALLIVSGDEDLLVLKRIRNISIITAKEFCSHIQVLERDNLKIV